MAGVVGTHKFLYDVWGGACNLASRMESTGVDRRVQVCWFLFFLVVLPQLSFDQVSHHVREKLKDHPDFRFVDRGDVFCKGWESCDFHLSSHKASGIGNVRTFFLVGVILL